MQRSSAGPSPIICQAIQQLRKLIFDYNGLRRVVEPNDPQYYPNDSAMKRVICRVD